ncbi:protein trichome birefringence-like 43 [Chenopodium quinoa]|nr:protein trichome birefringence-like 43 [Chenopodium quinoa]
MELSSNVTATWKICTICSLIGCLMLVFLLRENDQNMRLFEVESTVLEIGPTEAMSIIVKPSEPPQPIASVFAELIPWSKNVTSNAIEKPKEVYRIEKSNVMYVNNIVKRPMKKSEKKCNMFDGRWVYKPDQDPSYNVMNCPFLEEKMSCQRNGRPDFEYEKWVWKPSGCDIPLLNGTDMVERFRNKRVILVGDSLNRNMWESLACILYSSIPNASSKAEVHSQKKVLKTFLKVKEDYNFTVEFFWSPFLVELNKHHESGKNVLVLDKLSPNSELWPKADIMVFNSGHWWAQIGKKKAWELFEYRGKLVKDMPLHIAYKRAMKTWAKWVENIVDQTKTTVFFRSISAEHKSPQYNQWCYTKTYPIMDESYKSSFPKSLIRVTKSVIKEMSSKSQVKYLDITKLSQYRIDAHPSIYRYKDWQIRAQKNMYNLTRTADCGHWCLPGVPDTWNRLFYASLFFDDSGEISSS